MRKLQRTHKLLARIARGMDNRLNPIMAKEMYQSVNSRAFLISSWLLLGLALLSCVTVWKTQTDDIGRVMFTGLFSLMACIALVLLPLGISAGLQKAISTRTLELVQITGISGRRLARGHLLAIAAKLALLGSMLAPFAVLSYLFGGIDVLGIAAAVYLLLLGSLLLSAAALWLAAVTLYSRKKRASKSGAPVALLLALVVLAPALADIYRELSGTLNNIGHWSGLLVMLGLATILCILLAMLLLAAAANALTFPQNRSSARPKFLLMLIMLAPALFFIITEVAFGFAAPSDAIGPLCAASTLLLFLCAFVWITDDPPSQRRQGTGNLLVRQFRNGPGPTIRYLILTMAGTCALATIMHLTTSSVGSDDLVDFFCLMTVTMTYVLYSTAIARIITGCLPLRFRTPSARRKALMLFVILNTIFLPILVLTETDRKLDRIPGGLTALAPGLYPVRIGGHRSPAPERIIIHMMLPALFGTGYYILAGAYNTQRRREQEVEANTKNTKHKGHRYVQWHERT